MSNSAGWVEAVVWVRWCFCITNLYQNMDCMYLRQTDTIRAAPCENASSGICGQRRPDQPATRTFWSGASLSANRIIGYCRMYDWRTNVQMIPCARSGWSAHAQDDLRTLKMICARSGWSESAHLAHVRRHFSITKRAYIILTPLKPHFYVVKLGFTEVIVIFLISAQNKDCGYSLEPPRRGGSNEYPQSMFWAEIWKISELFIWKLSFSNGKIFSIFE